VITVAQVLDVLEITQADVTIDLQALINRATATLTRELNIYLGPPTSFVEVRNGGPVGGPGSGFQFILLHQDPIPAAGASVQTRDRPTAAWLDVAAADFALEGRKLFHASSWPAGKSNVKATYSAGFVAGAASNPKHFEDMLLQMVAGAWESWQPSDVGAVKSETLGDYSYSLESLNAAAARLGGSWPSFANQWRRRAV
jgi:hypothetical protein